MEIIIIILKYEVKTSEQVFESLSHTPEQIRSDEIKTITKKEKIALILGIKTSTEHRIFISVPKEKEKIILKRIYKIYRSPNITTLVDNLLGYHLECN